MTLFKLPDGFPALQAHIEEWADYAEYTTLKEQKLSFNHLFKNPSLISDEILMDGVDDENDSINIKVEEIAGEIRKRITHTDRKYPFQLESKDYVITLNNLINTEHKIIYMFLLFCTRLNMSKNRSHGGHDGALLFEHLCAEVAKNYFGEKANVEVMGTGNIEFSGFTRKLANIVTKITELGGVNKFEHARPQDDNVDIVIWKNFADKSSSNLIAFGQCKTGTSWINHLSSLQPNVFCKTWFSNQPVIDPLRLFFCSQYFPKNSRAQHIYKAGLLFDRFRIMDYLPENINEVLIVKIQEWCTSVESKYICNS